ncbi:hypothetical protein FHX34_106134 [Actinoplanes teichomyceticus]|uniref:Uncharacterized protein n=1 Tax=Actinoplanes teichomyceticus TaxID=1867 RepID=A0A561VIJ4_ACTTI|nr:hypothetical protein FHX34_106134 [Actinoplanes teichomyceticus]
MPRWGTYDAADPSRSGAAGPHVTRRIVRSGDPAAGHRGAAAGRIGREPFVDRAVTADERGTVRSDGPASCPARRQRASAVYSAATSSSVRARSYACTSSIDPDQ